METFLSTFVFIIPGIMAYFWLQAFGLNPPVKHTASEVSGIAALLWLPISFVTLLLLNAWGAIIGQDSHFSVDIVWSFEEVNIATSDIRYLVLFLLVSFIVSFILSAIWSIWGHIFPSKAINLIRGYRNLAPLSRSSTAWDGVFLINEPQVIEIVKIGEEKGIIGEIAKVSRSFESDRNIYLKDMNYYSDLIEKYNIPVSNIFIDTKSGIYIKIFNSSKIISAIDKEETISQASDQKLV